MESIRINSFRVWVAQYYIETNYEFLLRVILSNIEKNTNWELKNLFGGKK